jgi:hypothetical protein
LDYFGIGDHYYGAGHYYYYSSEFAGGGGEGVNRREAEGGIDGNE